jgi:hypothetical protein
MKNRGVIIKKPLPTDYFFGGETGILFEEINPSGDWLGYLPTGEYQLGVFFDTMACVTFSALNCVETQINFLIKNGKLNNDKIRSLRDWGFLDESGNFNCSDRFTAKMSGTTHQGNTLTNVWDSIRKDGLVPEKMWAYPRLQREPVFSWDDYYQEIPQNIKDFAKNILTIFDFKYEWLYWGQCGDPNLELIKKGLKQCPIQIAAPVCPKWNESPVSPCGTCTAGHATMVFRVDNYIRDFDHYEPFQKALNLNYTIPYCLKGIVSVKAEVPIPAPVMHYFAVDMVFGERSEEVRWLQKALKQYGFFPANVLETGYYGTITQKAVKDFQYFYKVASSIELLIVNGKRVGVKTRTKLNELTNC